jgi:hypothetical protein
VDDLYGNELVFGYEDKKLTVRTDRSIGSAVARAREEISPSALYKGSVVRMEKTKAVIELKFTRQEDNYE